MSGVETAREAILRRAAAGELSPALGAAQLLLTGLAPHAAERLVRQAERSATDARARGRLAELGGMLAEHGAGAAWISEMALAGRDLPRQAAAADATGPRAAPADERIADCARLFDWAVERSEEGSVAAYSLGSPRLLEEATGEIVELFRAWGLLGPLRRTLAIGCGIGRVQAAVAAHVGAAVGIDISERMLRVARRRCAPLANVHFARSSGRDLSLFRDHSFDLVYAVDSFPYLEQAGGEIVAAHSREAARVLVPGGDFVLLNFSYRGDPAADRSDVTRLAQENGFTVVVNGERPFHLWDGLAFHLRRDRPSPAPPE